MNLTHEEQCALVVRAQAGDRKATEALLRFCERDVQGMVTKMKCSSTDREDLAQVARLAIVKAIPNFKPDCGKQFRFYAADWAREDARRLATTLSSVVVRNVRTRGMDVELDAPMHHTTSDGEATLLDTLESEEPTPEQQSILDGEEARVRAVLERIVARLRQKAASRYDRAELCRDLVFNKLLSEDPVTLDTLARRYGTSRETVRKLEMVIVKMARSALEATA